LARFSIPRLAPLLCIVIAASLLSGCGRRGPLEPPPGAPASNAPLTGVPEDPDAKVATGSPGANAVPTPGASDLPSGSNRSEKKASTVAPPKSSSPFFLDPLL
jgi:predicted small lipoprotein YifL